MFGLASSYTFYNYCMYIITHSRKKYNEHKFYSVSCLFGVSPLGLFTVREDWR